MIGQRTRTSQEFWLIDISALVSIESAELLFENFNLRHSIYIRTVRPYPFRALLAML
jgi:hypothetical protein